MTSIRQTIVMSFWDLPHNGTKKENNDIWSFYGKLPKDEDGKRRNYKCGGFKSKKAAKLAETEFLKQYNHILPTRLKLNDLIVEYHKDAPNHIKLSTIKAYKRFEKYVISPSFGNRYIDDITTIEITRWINNILQNGYNDRIYGESSTRNILLHLSGLFTYAVDYNWLQKNPCHKVKPLKDPNKVIKKQSREENFWEIKEYNQLINTVKDEYKRDLYEFMFLTGLRIGEFCALQWKDVDLINNKLRISKSLSAITSKITSPKTSRSNRTIQLPDRLVEKLKKRYIIVSQQEGFNEDYYLYKDQTYISIATLRRLFNEDVEKSGVKRITVHGLRHSHASYLLSNPMISELLIADRLGHSVEMLRSTYAHIYEKSRKNLIDFIDEL